MSRPRARWIPIAGTPARYAYERVERDGIAVLCVRLAGHADNSPDGVARVTDALDALGSTVAPDLDVTTLDVADFCNASDDACGILTHVFTGLPCCWITGQWDQQRDGQRWDLPPGEHMAPTREQALARVVGWRRAGGFSLAFADGGYRRDTRWTGRGLLVQDFRDDALDLADLWHRNRLVERGLAGAEPRRVLWPRPDRTGVAHEAERRRARLVYASDAIVEVDFSASSTGTPLADDWVAHIADLSSLATLVLRDTDARARHPARRGGPPRPHRARRRAGRARPRRPRAAPPRAPRAGAALSPGQPVLVLRSAPR